MATNRNPDPPVEGSRLAGGLCGVSERMGETGD